jgi:hypothetical protein
MRSNTGSPRARTGARSRPAAASSPLWQTAMAQIRRPCQAAGTNGAAGARSSSSHTANSRGAAAVMLR